MINGEIAYVQDGAEIGRHLVLRRDDGFFHYRGEWIEADERDGNGPYRNHRDYTSLLGTVDDAVREASTHIG